MTAITNTADLRKINKNRIYRYIYEAEGFATKGDITAGLELSLPTVSQNLTELLDDGLIVYRGESSSTGGRKARNIAVVSDARVAIGVVLSANHVRISTVDLLGESQNYQKVKMAFVDCPEYFHQLVKFVRDYMNDSGLPQECILGIGFALPGIIDLETNFVSFAPTMWSKGFFLDIVKDELYEYPTTFVNDASTSGYAECRDMDGTENMAFLLLDRGVGGAILTKGAPYAGDNGRSGEFGHICVVPGGKRCSCGMSGCLESYCSSTVLSYNLGLTLDEFFEKLKNGDEKMAELWDEYLNHLVIGIINIHMMLDCKVVIGGVVAPFLEPYMDVLQEKLDKINLFRGSEVAQLCRHKRGSANLGAGLYFVDNFIKGI